VVGHVDRKSSDVPEPGAGRFERTPEISENLLYLRLKAGAGD